MIHFISWWSKWSQWGDSGVTVGVTVLMEMMRKGGHPLDMEMAPLWSHFGSIYFFQWMLLILTVPLLGNYFKKRKKKKVESQCDIVVAT